VRKRLRRGSLSHLQRARDLAAGAAQQARRLGMPMSLAAADALLTRTRLAARAADPLTPREREVASLVAQARSNRDIAEQLVLSERTIEGHVRNILAKTGLSSRTELIRHVLRDPYPAE
jgi:DNA-binding NarL/FixJ family response regulator